MEEIKDNILRCIDCGEDFVFTVGEQRFFFSKSMSQPKRCQVCRNKRRANLVPDTGRKEETKCQKTSVNSSRANRQTETT